VQEVLTFKNQKFKDKGCHICGTQFTPNSPRHVICSHECKLKHFRNKNKVRYVKEGYKSKIREYKLRKKYNITTEDYANLLKSQNGCCKICSSEPTKTRKLCVDHCHKTGKVRGLLCDSCNRGIGLLGDESKQLKIAYKYLLEAEND
jgi:hypothetical protein